MIAESEAAAIRQARVRARDLDDAVRDLDGAAAETRREETREEARRARLSRLRFWVMLACPPSRGGLRESIAVGEWLARSPDGLIDQFTVAFRRLARFEEEKFATDREIETLLARARRVGASNGGTRR